MPSLWHNRYRLSYISTHFLSRLLGGEISENIGVDQIEEISKIKLLEKLRNLKEDPSTIGNTKLFSRSPDFIKTRIEIALNKFNLGSLSVPEIQEQQELNLFPDLRGWLAAALEVLALGIWWTAITATGSGLAVVGAFVLVALAAIIAVFSLIILWHFLIDKSGK